MVRNVDIWLKNYLSKIFWLKSNDLKCNNSELKVLFTICDHYEPFWNRVSYSEAHARVVEWVKNYQTIASSHTDSIGSHPKHCFFYPEEEYHVNLLEMVAEICRNGFGETEIHLHHDNDTAENLSNTLINFKNRLAGDHGLLSVDKVSSEIKYGFIHGNWALDNSRPDGRWCGVNNEIGILAETGCYADFTMPSAPDVTQTKTVNSIYYATDDPVRPKSHDSGVLAKAGTTSPGDLLCIQGPLALNFKSRKYGMLPRIENACFAYDAIVTKARANLWIDQRIHVSGRPDVVFVKLHTHGTQESNIDYFFKRQGLSNLFSTLEHNVLELGARLFYVSARQMYNVVKGLESRQDAVVEDILDYELKLLA